MAQKKRRKKKNSGALGGIGGVIVVLIVLLVFWLKPDLLNPDKPETPDDPGDVTVEGEVQVHVIDVGQGDSILIVTPGGNMLIDAGTNSSEDELKTYLDAHKITTFEYVIFTHPHEDHIGGADMVMRNYTVKNVILPDAEATTKVFTNMMDAIEQSDADVIEAVSGESYAIGDFKFRILAPNAEKYGSTNDYSVVIRATYGKIAMMFTGDAEGNAEGVSEKEILAKYSATELKCDFLKAGHHGSDTSSSAAFLDAVNPKLAAISVGTGNIHGHPCQSTLDAYAARGITYYRTDFAGSLVFLCDGETITYKSK